MKYRSSGRSVSELRAHLVLTTKYRRKAMSPAVLKRLTELVDHLCQRWGCQLIEFNGEADHVHLLFGYYPQLDLSKFVNNLKTVTSRMIRKEFASHLRRYYRKPVFWNSSYYVGSCGGVTVEMLKKYVQSQGQ